MSGISYELLISSIQSARGDNYRMLRRETLNMQFATPELKLVLSIFDHIFDHISYCCIVLPQQKITRNNVQSVRVNFFVG